MNYLIKQLVTILREKADALETGTSVLSAEETLDAFQKIAALSPDYRLSKAQACDYLNMRRSTFDDYVKRGLLPKGTKTKGWKELYWNKCDLDKFVYECKGPKNGNLDA